MLFGNKRLSNEIQNKEKDYVEMEQLLDDEFKGTYIPKGLIYMFLSCIFKTVLLMLCQSFLKGNPKISYFEILTFKSFFLLIISICSLIFFQINIFNKNSVKKEAIFPLFLIPLLGITSLTILIYSLRTVNISDFNFFFFLYPIFIIVIGYLLLGERLSSFDYLSSKLLFVATILVVKPEIIFKTSQIFSNNFSIFLIIIAALYKSFEYIIIRDIRFKIHFLIYPFSYALLGTIIFPIAMFTNSYSYPVFSNLEIVYLFILGLCTYFYYLFMVLALQNDQAGSVSIICYLQIVFFIILEVVLIKRKFDLDQLIGSLFMLCLILINISVKIVERKTKLKEFKEMIPKSDII